MSARRQRTATGQTNRPPSMSASARRTLASSASAPDMLQMPPDTTIQSARLSARDANAFMQPTTSASARTARSRPMTMGAPSSRSSYASSRSSIFTPVSRGGAPRGGLAELAEHANEPQEANTLVKTLQNVAHDDPAEFLMSLQRERDHQHRFEEPDPADEVQATTDDGHNQYSRPMMSSEVPLRSLFLDPEANNLPASRTQSDLRRTMRKVNMPHISYDIDGDGYVSQEDYFLAKRFDLDGNGVLDPDEQEVGRYIMAQEFFKQHRDDIHLFGDEWQQSEKDNIERLATAHTFQKLLNKLKETEKHYRDIGSHEATACLTMADRNLTKHNFYANKFDATAWNDFGAQPRGDRFNIKDHKGSRHTMYHLRQIGSRDVCQARLDDAEAKRPQFSKRRTSLITNWKNENG